uniref:Reverse transcriptase Ty1/copia-type domain-containing protein n=1 Tax=Fagus sylvatica TaxID=28930 RepID=A0A2N9FCZ8_FAGSY
MPSHSLKDRPPPQSTSDLDLPITICKVKQNLDGIVDRLKARLVAKGFTQTYNLDYTETFSLVAKLNSICIIIFLAANLDWPLHQLDVKNACLHGDLTETAYMAQPPRVRVQGEVQADHFVFYKKTRTGIVILVVYVDDIIITGSDKEDIQILIKHLSSSFLTKDLGKLCYFLGIEVARSKVGISLSQRKYTIDILQDTCYLGSKPVATPMEPNLKLMPNKGDFVDDPDTYRRLVGKLIYLTITQPDISYAVSIMSQFMTSSRVPYMNPVIHILKYLKNAPSRRQLFILLAIQSSTREPNSSKLIVISFVLKVESKDITTPFVPSESQLTDIFTKALPKNAIDSICSKLGVIDIYSPT